MPEVGVVLRRPFSHVLSYRTDRPLEEVLWRRVKVPLGRGSAVGYSVPLPEGEAFAGELKSLADVLDPEPLSDPACWEVAKWMAKYYFCSPGEAFSVFLPFGDTRFGTRNSRTNPLRPIGRKDLPVLTPSQAKAVERIRTLPEALLQGVTGSGKTRVVAELIREAEAAGKQSLFLIPEISLADQTRESLESWFPGRVDVIHSHMTTKEKYLSWRRIASGESRIILGARSALFAPFRDLGLVIVDEEHDGSYKNGQVPRYHARTVARIVARARGARLVYGSATPSMELLEACESGRLPKVLLTDRFGGVELPEVRMIPAPRRNRMLPESVLDEMSRRMALGEPVLVHLNRRGWAKISSCDSCGTDVECRRCSVALTWHKEEGRFRCHLCGAMWSSLPPCASCGGTKWEERSPGIEKLADEIRKRFPEKAVGVIDGERLRAEGRDGGTFEDFRAGRIDLLVGTQIIAKGHDFERLSFVVIVFPENAFALPDFRAEERAFSQLAQMAGRSGRRRERGQVWMVTRRPDHPVFRFVEGHDVDGFFARERERRRDLGYPPFRKLWRLVIRGTDKEAVEAAAKKAADRVGAHVSDAAEILGPVPCLLEKIRKNYRSHLILKVVDAEKARSGLGKALEELRFKAPLHLEIDVDPVDLL